MWSQNYAQRLEHDVTRAQLQKARAEINSKRFLGPIWFIIGLVIDRLVALL